MVASRSAYFSTTSRQDFSRWWIFVHFKKVVQIASAITPTTVTLFLLGVLEPCVCSNRWRRWHDLFLRRWLLFMEQHECGGGISLRQQIRWLFDRIRVCNFSLGFWLLAGFDPLWVLFYV
ncbi:hypothetical protein RchiOBHm_Chr6g0282901 [Rosa chinensis]|uniref:Transmembrane protein n=1 Tax=Rosa chinensis TaxID=74649 RepID=A0A2P6PTV9_ROSCH|nr:hypothetical protein RchiOBHm_Chr6g0282901 [Rosa chinensis]